MTHRPPLWPLRAIGAGALLLASCARAPEPYAPPAQYQLPARPAAFLIAPAEPGREPFLLEGIIPADPTAPETPFRWTAPSARFRLPRPQAPSLQFLARFAASRDQLNSAGPLRVAIRLDSLLLAEKQIDSTGIQEILVACPAGRGAPDSALVTLTVSPAALDRGVMLYTLGFQEPAR